MIDGAQRLAAAAAGRRSDRIPVFCNLLDQGAKELRISLREYYADGERVAEAQLRMRERYAHDNLWCLFYVGKEAELLGCKSIVFAEDGPPNVGEWVIRSADDIHALRIPEDVSAHPAFEEQLRCLRVLRREAGGRYPICAYVTASLTLPAILMGMEAWMSLLVGGPAGLRDELLAKCSELFQRQVAAYRAAGADIILYSNPFGSTDMVPMSLFREVSLPWMERDLAPIGTDGVVYYCGMARMGAVVEQVLARTGIGAYYLGPMDDIAAAKKVLAGRALCGGVINDIKLIDWAPRQVRDEVKRIIAAGLPGGRFLFGTGVMPYAIPEVNIRAMLDAAYELGAAAP